MKFLQNKEIDILMIADYEESRDVNLQYLSGHPSDSIVLIHSSGESILLPWDINIAEKHSEVDEIIDLIKDYNCIYRVVVARGNG